MGGRGASYSGSRGRAPRGYRTVGKSHGLPIIKSHLPKEKILPTEAKPNSRYLGMNKRGEIKQLRVYDKQGKVKMILIGNIRLRGIEMGPCISILGIGENVLWNIPR